MKKVLWVEDQFEDLMDYSSRLARIDYLVEPVKSVSDALEKLEHQEYEAYIFDLKILPGDDPGWQALDERKRAEKPQFDPLLGFELLRFLDKARNAQSDLWEKIKFEFSKVIVFSVVPDKEVYDELESFGIPEHQIVYKSGSDLDTLAEAIQEMQNEKPE
jgi:CheY-like chemotaxis protein